MTRFKGAALAAGLIMAAFSSGNAVSAPVSQGAGLTMPAELELVRHNNRHGWHGGRHQRCWWETRRVRDHRGRWVNRRVQVCLR